MKILMVCFLSFLCIDVPSRSQTETARPETVPLYRVTVVGRTAKAVNYGHRAEPTKVGMRGTVLMPYAQGEAKVESKPGAMRIDAKMQHLEPPTKFGREYLTYVLWAITPDGRATNLGEVVTNDDNKGKLATASELQAFALIVTAEPYYAVTMPSDLVVMENVIRPDTVGTVEQIEAKYELMPRGHYTFDVPAPGYNSQMAQRKVSLDEYEMLLELYQAQNAVQIARSVGADRLASDTLRRAEQLLQEARDAHERKAGNKTVVMTARHAAQSAEDARMIAMKRQEEAQAAWRPVASDR
jgi:hypothetical protein